MHLRTISLTFVAGAVLAATALAGSAAKDPSSLILRKADFSATAQYDRTVGEDSGITDALAAHGIKVHAASYLGVSFSRAKGSLKVSGAVFTPASVAIAKRAFTIAKKQRDTFWKRIGAQTRPIGVLLYGQQQFARLDPFDPTGIGTIELLVRRNAVLWLLTVNLERRPPPSTSELLGDLKKYASKQKTRIGAG
jgi:hypothetical protein